MSFKGTRKIITSLLLGITTGLCCNTSSANDDWWFDVEVIVFKRDISLSQLDEQFQLADSLAPYTKAKDIISARLQPNIAWLKQGLDICDAPPYPSWPEYTPKLEDTTEDEVTVDNEPEADSNTDGALTTNGMLVSEDSAEQSLATEEAFLEDDELVLSDELVETLTPEAELSSNEVSPEELPSDLVTDVIDTLERLPEPVVFPDEQQIADYWLDAFWLPRNVEGVREYKPLVTVTPAKTCRTEKPWLAFENNQWVRHTPNHFIPLPEYLAVVPEGVDWERHPGAHILSSESFELESLSRQIRQQRSLTRLLHTTWRQPVAFGEDNAFKVRLLGGHDLGLQFNLNGEPHPERPQITTGIFVNNETSEGLTEVIENSGEITPIENPTIFDRISDRLSSPEAVSLRDLMQGTAANETEGMSGDEYSYERPESIWELDGYLKVFLKYINSVPYLHIDSEVFLRVPHGTKGSADVSDATAPVTLVSLPFSEQRRVISKQLHYFDHPLFGMVVQIRRYRRPADPQSGED